MNFYLSHPCFLYFHFFQYFYVVTFLCVSSVFLVQYVIRFVVTSKPSNAMEKKLVKKAFFLRVKPFFLHACKQQ